MGRNFDVPPLRDYQIKDLAFHISRDRSLNLSDPGTGKTPPICVYMWYQWNDLGNKVVWAMPKSLLRKNKDEIVRFTPFFPEEVAILDGTSKKRQKLMEDPNHKVFLMTFEGLRREWRLLLEAQPKINCMIVDELHLGYSSHNSQRTQELYRMMRKVKYFIGMTGTLIKGRLDSAYPSIHIIEPRYYPSYDAFVNYHAAFIDDYGRVTWWQNEEKLQKILGEISVRHSFEEVYGKEAKILQVERVEMGPKMRKAYDDFHEQAMLELEDEFLDGSLPGVAVIRARQIMGHPETFGLCEKEPTGKDERLKIHLEDAKTLGTQLIIYAVLVPEQERIARLVEEAGLSVGLINGGVPSRRRQEIDEAFRAGNIQVVVASPKTAAVGFNWGHVDHVVFVSMGYEDDDFLQAYRRAMRGVREKPLRITVLQYENSIDQRIAQIIQMKSAQAYKIDNTQVLIEFPKVA